MEGRITVEGLKSETEKNYTSALMEYQESKAGKAEYLFCFVEGKTDSDYYMNIVQHNYTGNFVFIYCHNKKNLKKIFNKIYDIDHSSYNLAFFCDRDYDESFDLDSIYETPCYSIENMYTQQEAFEKFLQYGIKLSKDSKSYANALEAYKEWFLQFHVAIRDFNCYACAKNKFNRDGKLKHIDHFEKSLPNDFIHFKDYPIEITQLYNKDSLDARYHTEPHIPSEYISAASAELDSKDPGVWYRGKYEISAYIKFLKMLATDANSKTKMNIISEAKVSNQFNGQTFMSDFCQYSLVEEKLIDYIRSFSR